VEFELGPLYLEFRPRSIGARIVTYVLYGFFPEARRACVVVRQAAFAWPVLGLPCHCDRWAPMDENSTQ
jgi:hypothetical protein